jgi:hypothetical protein
MFVVLWLWWVSADSQDTISAPAPMTFLVCFPVSLQLQQIGERQPAATSSR